MNPMTLGIVSLPSDYKADSRTKTIESRKGSEDFFSAMRESMNSVQEKSFHKTTEPRGAGLPLEEEYDFYLESLRKGLLAKGKSLDEISLNGEDLLLLRKFLYQCSFSQEKVESFLRELAENNAGREINLSQFFHKIAELGLPKRKIYQPTIIDHSGIPYIESVLTGLGLTPEELKQAFSTSRVEGGSLDLYRFVKELKGISDQITGGGKGGQISIKDFIAALEQMTGRSGNGNQLPIDVKAAIDQILEKVVVAHQIDGPLSSLLAISQSRFVNLHSRGFLPAYLIDQIKKQISRSILKGERVIRLQLKPPELGVLKIELDIKDNILKLGMITENSSVRQLLLSSVHELREALVERGLKLERLDVQINHEFGQSLANSKEGLKEGQSQELNGVPFIAEDDTEEPISGPRNMVTGDHLLDLMA